LAFDDLTALGVMRGLACAGLQVPEDCSVLGFDDVLPAEVATPAITTIRQPLREMGLRAAEWTLEAIEEPELGHKRWTRLEMALPELVVRMSTVPVSRRSGKEVKLREDGS
jgi:LacI family transcriptional regulator